MGTDRVGIMELPLRTLTVGANPLELLFRFGLDGAVEMCDTCEVELEL